MPANWSFTMDSEKNTTIFRNRTKVWEGGYDDLLMDEAVEVPEGVMERIHVRADHVQKDYDTWADRQDQLHRDAVDRACGYLD